jgi:hypothetical protein
MAGYIPKKRPTAVETLSDTITALMDVRMGIDVAARAAATRT